MRQLPIIDVQSLDASGVAAIQSGDVEAAVIRNVARYTEDATWAYWSVSNTMTKGIIKKALVNGRIVRLTRMTSSNPFASTSHWYGAASMTPFVIGKKYLVSFYVYSDADMWFVPRSLVNATDNGHGVKWSPAGTVSRVWYLAAATSSAMLDHGNNPTIPLGSGAGANPAFLVQNANGPLDLYIGGIQIESVSAPTKDGIAYIGDSTFAGSAGQSDRCYDFRDPELRQVSTVLSALTNAPVFNRAIGGNRLTDMDARFESDILPLAHRSRYCVIQGGINDIANGSTLAQCQAPVLSMTAKAEAAGMICRYVTGSPTVSIGSNPAYEAVRQSFNAWLKSTYGSAVCDIDAELRDPDNHAMLRPDYYGDGTHYNGLAKTNVAKLMYQSLDWSLLPAPSQYSRVSS